MAFDAVLEKSLSNPRAGAAPLAFALVIPRAAAAAAGSKNL